MLLSSCFYCMMDSCLGNTKVLLEYRGSYILLERQLLTDCKLGERCSWDGIEIKCPFSLAVVLGRSLGLFISPQLPFLM